ncbi:MAG: DUF4339 domain-containing protein [Chthoniobacterales bacterium]|nr:DUF4339 domain-containing protein [Chthoniobacterales bacterium]
MNTQPGIKLPLRWKGQTSGPYDLLTLRRMLDEGDISLNHQVFWNGQWVSMDDFAADAGWLSPHPRPHPRSRVQETKFETPSSFESAETSNESVEAQQVPQSAALDSAPVANLNPVAAPPPPLGQSVHVILADGSSRVYEDKHLRSMLAQGMLRDASLYWKEGMAEWQPIANLGFIGLGSPPVSLMTGSHSAHDQFSESTPTRHGQAGPDPGIGRLAYFLSLLGVFLLATLLTAAAKTDPSVELGSNFVLIAGSVVLAVLRLQNIGKSGWLSLLLFLPIANLYVGMLCLFAPAGYARTKKLDTVANVIISIIIGFIVLAVLAVILTGMK